MQSTNCNAKSFEAGVTNRRTTIALELLLLLVAGGMAFSFLDVLLAHGLHQILLDFYASATGDALSNAYFVWPIISLFMWLVFGLVVNYLFKKYSLRAEGEIVLSQRIITSDQCRSSATVGCDKGRLHG